MSAVPPCFLTLSLLTQTTREHLRRMAFLYSPLTLSAFRFQSYLPLVPLKRAFSILPFSLADFQMYSSFSTPFATIHHNHKKSFCQQKNEPEVPIHFTFALSLFTGEVFFPLPFNQSHNSIMFRLRALAFHTNSRYKTLARKFFTLLLLSRFPGSWINASPPFSYNFIQWVSPASLPIYSDRLAQALHLIPFSPILCGQYRCTQQFYGIILDL